MIIVNIDFRECSVEITQDNYTQSNGIISTYHRNKDQARVTTEIRGSIDNRGGSICPQDLPGHTLSGSTELDIRKGTTLQPLKSTTVVDAQEDISYHSLMQQYDLLSGPLVEAISSLSDFDSGKLHS